MLDAILAATESLVITYTGADEHTGQPRPPAVPLGELLDALDRTTDARRPRGCRGRAPAAALRRKNLEPGRLGTPDRSPSIRPRWSLRGPRPDPGRRGRSSWRSRWSLPAGDDVALADLLAFFRDPVKGFFRRST